jgi:hypothetical protein
LLKEVAPVFSARWDIAGRSVAPERGKVHARRSANNIPALAMKLLEKSRGSWLSPICFLKWLWYNRRRRIERTICHEEEKHNLQKEIGAGMRV